MTEQLQKIAERFGIEICHYCLGGGTWDFGPLIETPLISICESCNGTGFEDELELSRLEPLLQRIADLEGEWKDGWVLQYSDGRYESEANDSSTLLLADADVWYFEEDTKDFRDMFCEDGTVIPVRVRERRVELLKETTDGN